MYGCGQEKPLNHKELTTLAQILCSLMIVHKRAKTEDLVIN